MIDEIAAAVVFITRLLQEKNGNIDKRKLENFSDSLSIMLRERFKNHWYEELPQKGQAYRCIRVTDVAPDPVLQQAAYASGLHFTDLQFPQELTLWVDPSEVTCRIGEVKGCYCTVANFKEGKCQNQAHTMDICQLLDQHNQRKNQAMTYFQQASSSRSLNLSYQDDAGVIDGSFYSPTKFRKFRPHHKKMRSQTYSGFNGNHVRYSSAFDQNPSPPADQQLLSSSPTFLPNAHAPITGHRKNKPVWHKGAEAGSF